MQKVGRNYPCPCGSGKKYKKCCMIKDRAQNLYSGYPVAQDGLEASSHNADSSSNVSSDSHNNPQLRGRAAEIQNIFRRGCNQLDRGEYERASKAFTSVLRLDPMHYKALTGLGRCFAEMGMREEARKCFEKALDINPDYVQARLNLDL